MISSPAVNCGVWFLFIGVICFADALTYDENPVNLIERLQMEDQEDNSYLNKDVVLLLWQLEQNGIQQDDEAVPASKRHFMEMELPYCQQGANCIKRRGWRSWQYCHCNGGASCRGNRYFSRCL
ncbi:uncharacterized protein LOC143462949 [Clavelina lepadiformis]|uniref:Cocaine- and amphetamine-regulated transcript protein n=1 Tax=Clavelina lepadiformis TaxID=159417 RepID=A0ABP0FN38_CLALP